MDLWNFSKSVVLLFELQKKTTELGQSHDLHNLGLKNTKRLTRVEIIQHDAAGGVLDCFNSSEKLGAIFILRKGVFGLFQTTHPCKE